MPSIADLRRMYPDTTANLKDEDIVSEIAKANNWDLNYASARLGYSAPSSDLGKEFYAGGNRYLAGMGHIGAAVGLPGAEEYAARKEARANMLQGLSSAPHSWDEVKLGDSDKGVLNYVGQTFANSAPYIAEAGGYALADAATGGALTPAILARYGAMAPRVLGGGALREGASIAARREALQAGEGFARSAMVPVVTYPSSLGDVLGNQHDQSGTYDLTTALPYAAGYAAGNFGGLEGAIAGRNINALSRGLTGSRIANAGLGAAEFGAKEAGQEVYQELYNQHARAAVDPTYDPFGDKAMEQYKESAIGAAFMGGLPGGIHGGMFKKSAPVVPGQESDLLGGNGYPALPSPNQFAIPMDNSTYPMAMADHMASADRLQKQNDAIWAARNEFEQRRNPPGQQDLLGDPLAYPIQQQQAVVPEADNVFGAAPAAPVDPTQTTPNRRQMSLDLSEPTRPEVLYGNQYNPASQPGATGQQAGAFTQLPVTDPIRTPPGAVQQAVTAINGTRTIAQLKATADQALTNNLISPDQHVEFYNTLDTNKKLKLVDKRGLLTTMIEGNQNGNQENVAGRQEGNVQAGQPQGAVASREVGIAQGAAQGRGAQAQIGRNGEAQGLLNGTQTQEAVAQQAGQPAAVPVPDIPVPAKPANSKDVNDLPRFQKEMQSYLTNQVTNDELQAFIGLNGLRGEDGNAEGYSTRALAKDMGVSHVTVFNRANSAKSKIDTAAAQAGIDSDTAMELLGLGSDVLDVGIPTVAYENGVKTVRSESDDFEDGYGYSRDEAPGDNGKGGIEDAYAEDTSDKNAVGSAEFERIPDGTDDRADFARKLVDYNGNPISDVDFKDAGDEYNSNFDGEYVRFDELSPEKQIQVAKAYVAMMDKKLSEQGWVTAISGVEDEALNTRRTQDATGAEEKAVRGVLSKDSSGSEGGARKSVAESANPTTVDGIKAILKPLFFTNSRFDNRVTVVKSTEDLPLEALRFSQVSGGDAQAFVLPNGRAYMIADNIDAGTELAVFLHEVGVHLGMERLLGGNENFLKLAQQIAEWYDRKDDSSESKIAHRAIRRTTYAASTSPDFSDTDFMHEIVAYFVEEAVNAGYTPNAAKHVKTGINAWLKALWDYAKAALRKFGIDRLDTLTTQDVVDLAMAAAHVNMTGRNTEGEVGSAVRFSRKANPSTPEGFFSRLGASIQDIVDDPKAAMSRWKLGWMTLEQIADRVKSDAVKTYVGVMTKMQAFSKDLVYQAAKIDQDWAKLSPAVQKNLSEIMREATRAKFDPENEVSTNDANTALRNKFNALPESAQQVYRRVRDHYEMLFNERKAIMMKAAANGTLPEKNKSELDTMLNKFKGPYFPLMRIGNWYAVGVSNELAALQAKVDAGEATDAEQKQYAALRKDKAHYITQTYDSRSKARRAQKALAAQYDQAYFNTAKSRLDSALQSIPDLTKMQEYLTAGLPADASGDINGMLAQMYFDMLPDTSALKRLMKREGIYGEEEDMRKVFAASTISMSHHVSRLKYSTDLSAALQGVKNQTKRDENMTNVFNELVARANLATKSDETPFADRMTQISYLANLGLSPAFVLTNMTQVPMITAPWLTARYGFSNSRAALSAAFADAAKIISGTIQKDGWQAEYDWSRMFKEGSNEDRLLKELLDLNLLDITMEHDLGVVAKAAQSKMGKGYDTFIKMSSMPVRATEAANRIITGLSAYRLELAKLEKDPALTPEQRHTKAVEVAAKAISETQLNYSALNAPRHMQSVLGSKALAKMVFQFRKYQQGMVYLIGKNAADAFKGDKEARNTLFGLLTTTGLMAGTAGLPFAGSAFWMASVLGSMFGDDDEPFDAEVAYANYLADLLGDDVALAVRKGLPTLLGTDLSNNVGMANIGMPLPYLRNGNKPSEDMSNMLSSAAGASFQTMQTIADGIVEMAGGDFAKGVEKVTPIKGAKNIMKALRYANEGMTDSKGNVILPPEQFSPWDLAIRSTGFSTTKESEYYAANSAMQDAKQAANNVRTKLLRDYAEARMAGEDTSDFQEKIADFNTRHPEKGVRIDQSSLLKSVQQRKQMALERTSTGLRKDKAMKPHLDRAAFADGE